MNRVILEASERPARYYALIVFWAAILIEATLKLALPYVHWVLSAFVAALIVPYLVTFRFDVDSPSLPPAILFVISVCIPPFYGADLPYSLAEAAKLALILVFALFIFVKRSELAHWAFSGLLVAVWLNVALLTGGMAGLGTAHLEAGRWGTVLNYPGSLSRVGVAVWVYAAYLAAKTRSLRHVALVVGASLLAYCDGSRTSLLLLFVAAGAVIAVLAVEAGKAKKALLTAAMGLGLLSAALVYAGIFSPHKSRESGGLARLRNFTGSIETKGFEGGLEAADIARFAMIEEAVRQIRAHPVFGTGIHTTHIDTIFGAMPIHMAYLQVWADLGLLGLVAYGWLIWGWVAWLPGAWRRIRDVSDDRQRALYYNAIFLLCFFGMADFFHPMSTEWSDWILFVIPYALVWEIARSRRAIRVSLELVESYA